MSDAVTLSHGWAVGESTDSDGTIGVMLFVLDGPISLTPESAQQLATALLMAAKNCSPERSGS